MKRRSAGFTLVELVVAFALLGIAVIAIGGFLVTGVRSYNNVNAETTVQNEAQIALDQIQEVVIDAGLGVSYNVQTSGNTDHFVKQDSELTGGAAIGKYLYVFNWDGSRTAVDALLLKYDPAEKKLYFAEVNGIVNGVVSGVSQTIAQAVDVNAASTQWELLAEGVEEFSVDMTKYDTEHQISAAIRMVKSGKEFATNTVITLRNDVLINAENIGQIYERVDAVIETKITGVELTASSNAIVKGGNLQLTTTVLGTGYPSQTIYRWTVESVPGVTISKDANGKITVSGENTSSNVMLYDSLAENNSGNAEVTATKQLKVALGVGDDLLKITAIVYAGKDEHNQPVYLDDSVYIAVKDITNFTIQPDQASKTKYPDNNGELVIPSNPYQIASIADRVGTTVPNTSDIASNPNFVDVFNDNKIDMIGTLTGANLDEDDKKIIWSVMSALHDGDVSINSSGTITVSPYAQQGWAIIVAYPQMNSDMKLYYLVNIGTKYGASNNALVITSNKETVNRGGNVQLGLTLNGHVMNRLSDFDWSFIIKDNLQRNVDKKGSSLSDTGVLAMDADLSYDYMLTVEVTASMKSNPEVMAKKLITVPRVSMEMTEPTLITKRATTIPEGTTRCIVTGLETFELEWQLASQTNPSYYNSILSNGSYITGMGGDTCEIYISGSEPQSLTYMRARARLASNRNYSAETYLSLKDVSLTVTGGDSVTRGGSVNLSASIVPSGSGMSVSGTTWTVVKATRANGNSAPTEGITFEPATGGTTALKVSSDYERADSAITIVVKASLNGMTAQKNVTIPKSEELKLEGDSSVMRGGTATVRSNYGSEMEWAVDSVSNGSADELTLTKDSSGNCVVNVPVYFDTTNSSDTAITIKGTVKGTSITKYFEIAVTQVRVNLNSVVVSNNSTKKYNCAATVTGLAFGAAYEMKWAINGDGGTGRETTYRGITITRNTGDQSRAVADITSKEDSVKKFYAIAYVNVIGKNGAAIELAADKHEVNASNLKPYTEVRASNQTSGALECFTNRVCWVWKGNKWVNEGNTYVPKKNDTYQYEYRTCIAGYAERDTSAGIEYYTVMSWQMNDTYNDYRNTTGPANGGWYYLAYDTNSSTWYYADSDTPNWTEITGATTVYEVFGYTDTTQTAIAICNKLKSAYQSSRDDWNRKKSVYLPEKS